MMNSVEQDQEGLPKYVQKFQHCFWLIAIGAAIIFFCCIFLFKELSVDDSLSPALLMGLFIIGMNTLAYLYLIVVRQLERAKNKDAKEEGV